MVVSIFPALGWPPIMPCDVNSVIVINSQGRQGTRGWQDYTGSFSKVVLSQGAVKQVFLAVFLMFLAFFYSKIWAQFHFGTFKPYK